MLKEICKEDGVMSPEFMAAVKARKKVQVNTHSVVGWVDVSKKDLQFRNSVEYRIKPE